MVSPLKMPSISLPPLVSRKILGSGQGGLVALQPLDRAQGQDQHPVLRLAAQDLLPGPGHDVELGPGQVHGERGRGRVAQGEAPAVVPDPVAVGHAHARGGAVPAEHDVPGGIDLGEVRELAVGALSARTSSSLSCFSMSVSQPSPKLSNATTSTPRAPRRLHIAHSKAPVSEAGQDADAVVGRDAQDRAAALDHLDEARLGRGGAVRPAEHGPLERRQRPARPLGGRAGAEVDLADALAGDR